MAVFPAKRRNRLFSGHKEQFNLLFLWIKSIEFFYLFCYTQKRCVKRNSFYMGVILL